MWMGCNQCGCIDDDFNVIYFGVGVDVFYCRIVILYFGLVFV